MQASNRAPSHAEIPRRAFLKTAGAVGIGAAAGLEGVLAARRAPAFGQTTKLHLLQWVDFIPDGDVGARRQVAGYSPQMQDDATFATFSANDLERRVNA